MIDGSIATQTKQQTWDTYSKWKANEQKGDEDRDDNAMRDSLAEEELEQVESTKSVEL